MRTKLLPAVALCTLALVAAGPAAASPALTQTATNTCWLDVVNDWLAHQPNVTGTYPIACYTQAIQHLNGYPDVQNYSSAMDDIHRALLAAIHQERGNGGGGPGGGPSSNPGPSGDKTPPQGPAQGPTKSGKGVVQSIADRFSPGNAQSIPLPLLVLGGLAVLLLLAAGATWLARRLQARRVTPATAPAQSPRPRG